MITLGNTKPGAPNFVAAKWMILLNFSTSRLVFLYISRDIGFLFDPEEMI